MSEHEILGVDLHITNNTTYRFVLVYRLPHELVDKDETLHCSLNSTVNGKTSDFNCHIN